MRGLPHVLFGLLTILCFRGFLFGGGTLYDVQALERYLGTAAPEQPAGFFRPPPFGRADTLQLLPFLHRNYNAGLKSGELRLWNPMLFCGGPAYADPMLHPFYPPHLVLHLVLPPAAAYEVTLMLHLYFAGAAMFWLLLGMGRNRAAATVGALAWMFWGYHAFWFSTGVLAGVSVFLPLAMLALLRAAERRSLPLAALGGASMGLVVLGSHPQHALLVFLFLLAWRGVAIVRERASRGHAVRALAVFGTVMVLVGLPAILTRLDSIANGLRAPSGEFDVLYPGFGVILHVADIWIGKASFMSSGHARSEFVTYAGFAVTALAVAGAVRGWRDPVIRFAAIAAGALLLVVFVRPLAALAHSIPLLNLSQPTRWVAVIGFCVPLLAAFGVDALKERPGRTAWFTGGAAAIFVLAWPVAGLPTLPAVETLIGMALAVGAVRLVRSMPKAALGLCLGAVLFDLLPGFLAYNVHRDGSVLEEPPEVLAEIAGTETNPTRAAIVWGTRDGKVERTLFLPQYNNLLALYGVEAAAGYEAIAPRIMAEYCAQAGGGAMAGGRGLFLGDASSRMLPFSSVSHLLVRSGDEVPPGARRVGSWGPFTVYENPSSLPRAYVGRAPRDPGGAILPDASGGGRVNWRERSSDRQVLEVSVTKPGILVIGDAWYPGWEADVDGEPAAVQRVNGAFRGVTVSAGDHVVTLRFRPPGAGLPWIVSVLVMAAVGAWAARSVRRAAPTS